MGDIELVTVSELIDKLMIVNIKLYHLLDRATELKNVPHQLLTNGQKDEIINLSGDNIELVKQRSTLRKAIDCKLNKAILDGHINVLNEIKDYGAK